MKYLVECQVTVEVESGSESDVEEQVEEELGFGVELIAINAIRMVQP